MVERFVHWYNTEHKHSTLNYVTPDERHQGKDKQILVLHRQANPARWLGNIRNCESIGEVELNPDRTPEIDEEKAA